MLRKFHKMGFRDQDHQPGIHKRRRIRIAATAYSFGWETEDLAKEMLKVSRRMECPLLNFSIQLMLVRSVTYRKEHLKCRLNLYHLKLFPNAQVWPDLKICIDYHLITPLVTQAHSVRKFYFKAKNSHEDLLGCFSQLLTFLRMALQYLRQN